MCVHAMTSSTVTMLARVSMLLLSGGALPALGYSATPPPASRASTAPAATTAGRKEQPIAIPWLIVGGGIHGVHISTRLLGSNVVGSVQDICIVDDHDALLHSWKSRTQNTGMEYLRSSAGFHVGVAEDALRMYGKGVQGGARDLAGSTHRRPKVGEKKKKRKKRKAEVRTNHKKEQYFTNDYERPQLDFFNRHCDSVVAQYRLDQIHTQGTVSKIEPCDEYVRVHVVLPGAERGRVYHAENIVLALGNDVPSYADWVEDRDVRRGHVRHLLEIDDRAVLPHDQDTKKQCPSVAVVGGGITAAHKVLELVRGDPAPASIHLISRHPLREQQFDTHQEWMMDRAAAGRSKEGGGHGLPRRQLAFQQCGCRKERRQIIARERIPGTVTSAVNRGKDGLQYAIAKGAVQWHQAEIIKKTYTAGKDGEDTGQLELTLSCGDTLRVDQVLLATGFGKKVPGGAMLQDLIQCGNLQVSEFCGYPIVDEHLRWKERIYVAGPLAELEVGPSARNIAGARLAAERIIQAFVG